MRESRFLQGNNMLQNAAKCCKMLRPSEFHKAPTSVPVSPQFYHARSDKSQWFLSGSWPLICIDMNSAASRNRSGIPCLGQSERSSVKALSLNNREYPQNYKPCIWKLNCYDRDIQHVLWYKWTDQLMTIILMKRCNYLWRKHSSNSQDITVSVHKSKVSPALATLYCPPEVY